MIAYRTIHLSISCVYFDTDEDIFNNTIHSLAKSITHAKNQGVLIRSELHLINNNPSKNLWFTEKAEKLECLFDKLITYTGHGNIGYGRGNNLGIFSAQSDLHLILNPDVILAENNIFNALTHMQSDSRLEALAADAFDANNNRLYLAKRQPSIIVLFARAVNLEWLNKLLKLQLEKYEYRDLIPKATDALDIEIMSGCYMLIQTQILKSIRGFDERYFLYFEDFDLSNKLKKKTLFFDVKIFHYGGNASRKGIKHVLFFLKSMTKFMLNRTNVNSKSL